MTNHEITENLVIGDVVAYEGRWHTVIAWREEGSNGQIELTLACIDTEDECESVALSDAEWRLRRTEQDRQR